MGKSLEELRDMLKEVDSFPLRDEINELKKKVNEKLEGEKIEKQLAEVIDWLCKLTHAHKIKWFTPSCTIGNTNETTFCGFRMEVRNGLSPTFTSGVCSNVTTDKIIVNLDNLVTTDKPIETKHFTYQPTTQSTSELFFNVTHVATGTRILIDVPHRDLKRLKAEIQMHCNNHDGTDMDYFHKSIKNASDWVDRDPETSWG